MKKEITEEKIVKVLDAFHNYFVYEKYSLINNYGYEFEFKGKTVDIRHILNVYGCPVDYWEITIQYENNYKRIDLNNDNISLLSNTILDIVTEK